VIARSRLCAPAKINLGLRIVGRRADGYHELESLFAVLDLADELELEIERADAPSVALRLESPESGNPPGASNLAPPGASNLAARAAELFLAETGLALRVAIALRKHTPVAAGLGGGSSDAAAVLRALAAFAPDALGPGSLAKLALRLGADVPFFLDPRAAFVRGIGETIEPVRGLPALPLVLANPGEPLATREVFRVHDVLHADANRPASRKPALPDFARLRGDPGAWASQLHNDLEPAALRLCPAIGRLRAELTVRGARAIGLSGSGPTLFGIFESHEAARAAAAAPLRPPAWLRVATAGESARVATASESG
jgi:4-diphosphocytidyl-2-C-methyl-D-erythritol kinase